MYLLLAHRKTQQKYENKEKRAMLQYLFKMKSSPRPYKPTNVKITIKENTKNKDNFCSLERFR